MKLLTLLLAILPVISNAAYPYEPGIWTKPMIPVCWVSLSDSSKADRDLVQQAVKDTYEPISTIRFTGWGLCPQVGETAQVRLGVTEGRSFVPYIGQPPAWVETNVYLNLEDGECESKYPHEHCIVTASVHEFMHVLGGAHEYLRANSPATCNHSALNEQHGTRESGQWDTYSVLNYCNPVYNNGGKLSTGDIQMIQTYYGNLPRYYIESGVVEATVVNYGGKTYKGVISDGTIRSYAETSDTSSFPQTLHNGVLYAGRMIVVGADGNILWVSDKSTFKAN